MFELMHTCKIFTELIIINISINPKSVISAISPVRKSETECKTVKLKTIESSDKIELVKKCRTKI